MGRFLNRQKGLALLVLVLIIAFPQTALWLPEVLYGK